MNSTSGTPGQSSRRVLLVEVNEADAHFLDKYVAEGRLPHLSRMLQQGARSRTTIPEWNGRQERAWRLISPWIVWPSLYTGLSAEQHQLVAFGQSHETIEGRCVWDVLDTQGVSVGVFGSLQSHPPRSHGHCAFYVPEALADDDRTIPEEVQPLQAFFILGARNYSESMLSKATEATKLLMQSIPLGVRPRHALRTLAQVPAELVLRDRILPERANLHTYLSADVFRALYRKHRPRFATIHMNHVAYMQHRYWRAAEPDRFTDDLGPADRVFFGSTPARKRHESRHAHRIREAFELVDAFLGQLMEDVDDDTLVVLATGLGQHAMDPAGQIHNPVVRFVEPEALFAAIGVHPARTLHQMNPDLTLDFEDETAAETAEARIEGLYIAPEQPLFDVARRGSQVFIELRLPPSVWDDEHAAIRHRTEPLEAPWRHHIHVSPHREQSTAHHHDKGLLIAWSRGHRVRQAHAIVPLTDVAPWLVHYFDAKIPDWMNADPTPPFEVD